jgi:transketolase
MSDMTDIRDAFFDELYRIAEEDQDVVFMTADMGAFSLVKFRKDFPERFVNVGISEQNLISTAAGLALSGKKVFVYAIIPFITLRCLEQIKVDLCVMNLDVAIVGAGAGFTYSIDGPTHQAIEDVSIMRALPRMTIFNPSEAKTATAAARQAYRSSGPVYIRLDKGKWPSLRDDNDDLAFGCSELRSGSQVLIAATGHMTHVALQVADTLKQSGVSTGLLELYRLKPLPGKMADIAANYKMIVTLEEHTLPGGMGGSIAEHLADQGIMIPITRFGIKDIYPEQLGERDWMLKDLGLDVETLTSRIALELHRVSCSTIENSMTFDGAGGALHSLDLAGFASLLGLSEDDFSHEVRCFIEETNFDYEIVDGSERERILLQIMETIDSGKLTESGPGKQIAWEKGWSENLIEFEQSGNDLKTLVPKFVRKNQVMRKQGAFIFPSNPDFESDMVHVMRDVLFRKYFSDLHSVFEFGCGTGLNLLHLADIFPEKTLYGLDWAQSSCDIINRLADTQKINLKGLKFDMFNPASDLELTANDGVFTIGALEQLGTSFDSFLSFLSQKSPAICIHLETMNELYTNPTLSDHLIKRYGHRRNYLDGFLSALKKLEQSKTIEILQIQRTFGSLYHEGYSFVVWRTL